MVVACRFIVSAPVPVPFLLTLDLGFWTWIWDLDFGLGFWTGLGLDNSHKGLTLSKVNSISFFLTILPCQQVPLGWKIRFDCELNQDEFLSPDMRVFTNKQHILQLADRAELPGEKAMAEHIKSWAAKQL